MGGFSGNGFLPGSQTSGGGGGEEDTDTTKKVVTFLIASAPASSTTSGNRVSGNTNYPFYVAPRGCVLTGISAWVNASPAGSTALVRVSVDGAAADSTLTLSITAGAVRVFSTTGTGVAITAGQTVRAQLITDGSWTATAMITTVDLEFNETVV